MISSQELLLRVRIERQHLDSWIAQGWLASKDRGDGRFSEIDVARAQLIRELKEDFGINDPGVSLILHLLDQLHGVRRSMRELLRRRAEM